MPCRKLVRSAPARAIRARSRASMNMTGPFRPLDMARPRRFVQPWRFLTWGQLGAPTSVTPAKAGVQGDQRALATLDPGFRRDDEQKSGASHAHCPGLPPLAQMRRLRPPCLASRESPLPSSAVSRRDEFLELLPAALWQAR